MKKIPLNIPNILSLYRIIIFPVIIFSLIKEYEQLFIWLICISLVTDILDGWIARTFDMQTKIGAKLDSIADVGTYIGAILGVMVFKYSEFEPHFISFFIFVGLFISANVLAFIKFGKSASLHLYSSKIGGYLQGFFFFILFVFDFYTPFYFVMIAWGIASFVEHILVQLVLKRMKSNVKGLYWVLKEKNKV